MHLFWKVCYNAVLLEALSYLQPYFQLILFVFLCSTSYCCVNSDYFFATLVFSLFISHEFLRISYKIVIFIPFTPNSFLYQLHSHFPAPPNLLSSFLFLVWITSLTQNFGAYIIFFWVWTTQCNMFYLPGANSFP